jgi:hypothetical protein
MTIEEVVRDYIRETVKPLTPDQARIKALQGNVDRARLALHTARDQQRQRKESERRARASQARAAIGTSLRVISFAWQFTGLLSQHVGLHH